MFLVGVGRLVSAAARQCDRPACVETRIARARRGVRPDTPRPAAKQRAHALQVLGRVDTRPGRVRATCTAMRSPCHSTRSCSSASVLLQRRRRQRREAAQETGAVGVQADVAQRRRACGSAGRARGQPSRHQGIGARVKYSARPAASSTTLTTFGFEEVGQVCRSGAPPCSSRSRCAAASSSAQRRDQRRVDQRFVALHVDHHVVAVQAEQRRRPRPGGRCRWRGRLRVSTRGARRARRRPATMRSSSAATTTRSAPLRGRALGHAHHHRRAGDVGQRLVGQARRRQPRRDQDGEAHCAGVAVGRASSGALRSPASPGCRRGSGRPGGRRGTAARSGAVGVAAHSSGPLQTGQTSRSIRRWSRLMVGSARAARDVSTAARSAAGKLASLAAPPRPASRRCAPGRHLDRVLLGDHAPRRCRPARAGWSKAWWSGRGRRAIVQPGLLAAWRRTLRRGQAGHRQQRAAAQRPAAGRAGGAPRHQAASGQAPARRRCASAPGRAVLAAPAV